MQTSQARPRVGLEILVTVTPEAGRSHLGRTTNLSPSGMLLSVGAPLEVGGRIGLRFFLPGSMTQMNVSGEVTRDAGQSGESYSYGIRFVGLTQDAEAALERFHGERLERRRS